MNDNVRIWFEYAKTDYKVACHLNETCFPKPCEIICYHCQQAAEKAIKAVIIKTQNDLPQKHDLFFLMSQIKNMVDIPEECYDCADILTPYSTTARYPNELFLDDRKAEEALICADKILKWAEDIIEKE